MSKLSPAHLAPLTSALAKALEEATITIPQAKSFVHDIETVVMEHLVTQRGKEKSHAKTPDVRT